MSTLRTTHGGGPHAMTDSANDRACFEHAVLEVLPQLVGTAGRLAKNCEDAEDLAAEAITRWGTPEQEFLDRLLREDLIRAIEGLLERFRVVVVTRKVAGSFGAHAVVLRARKP